VLEELKQQIYIAVMIISDKQGCSDFSIDKV